MQKRPPTAEAAFASTADTAEKQIAFDEIGPGLYAFTAEGRSLKETFLAAREAMDPKFSSFAIYQHCLPFNVSRAYDEARGLDWPVIWTAARDREMWAALQG